MKAGSGCVLATSKLETKQPGSKTEEKWSINFSQAFIKFYLLRSRVEDNSLPVWEKGRTYLQSRWTRIRWVGVCLWSPLLNRCHLLQTCRRKGANIFFIQTSNKAEDERKTKWNLQEVWRNKWKFFSNTDQKENIRCLLSTKWLNRWLHCQIQTFSSVLKRSS